AGSAQAKCGRSRQAMPVRVRTTIPDLHPLLWPATLKQTRPSIALGAGSSANRTCTRLRSGFLGLGRGADPQGALGVSRPARREPEGHGVKGRLRAFDGDAPEANVVALARAVVDRPLEADVLSPVEQVKRN